MNPHLFAYGTLLSAAGHPMGDRLRREARLLGEASIEGQLFNLGRYPGLTDATATGTRVHGEVYALNAPAASFQWLDAYEGIVPGNEVQNDYRRIEKSARLVSGENLAAWVYIYCKPVAASSLIPGGRWSPNAK